MKKIDLAELKLIRVPHSPENQMRAPWIKETIQASYQGEKIGYLNMAYVPTYRLESFNEDPFLIKDFFGGSHKYYKHVYTSTRSLTENEEFGDQWKSHLLPNYPAQARWVVSNILMEKRAFNYSEDYPALKVFCEEASHDDLKTFLKKHHKATLKKIKNEHQSSLDYHFARPDIDYIFVEEDYRGQRIAEQLYRAGSKWMNEKGLVLHSSILQSTNAQAAWSRLEEEGKADRLQLPSQNKPRFRFIEDVPKAWLEPDFIFPAPFSLIEAKPHRGRRP